MRLKRNLIAAFMVLAGVVFAWGQEDALTIGEGGNVGIHNNEPDATLDVDGDVKISGELDVAGKIFSRINASQVVSILENDTRNFVIGTGWTTLESGELDYSGGKVILFINYSLYFRYLYSDSRLYTRVRIKVEKISGTTMPTQYVPFETGWIHTTNEPITHSTKSFTFVIDSLGGAGTYKLTLEAMDKNPDDESVTAKDYHDPCTISAIELP